MEIEGAGSDEDLRAIQEIVDAATLAFNGYNMFVIGQALSALLGMYFHRLGSDAKRMEIGRVLLDAATATCRGLEEDEKRSLN